MDFTIQGYKDLVRLIQEKGYDICNYYNYLESKKFVIMRHDIDFDLQKAVHLAEIENQMGISSVYFVLISSNFYNIISECNTRYLNEIASYGHEIGLHFDEAKYKELNIQQIEEKVFEEAGLLEEIIGRDVKTVSMHRPSKIMLESDLDFCHILNTYGKKFFKDMKYLSDARMNWREDVISILENEEFDKIQLLTHPFWYTEKKFTITEKLKKFVVRASEERYRELDGNLRDLESVLPRKEIYADKDSGN